jgi:hypothetical protein
MLKEDLAHSSVPSIPSQDDRRILKIKKVWNVVGFGKVKEMRIDWLLSIGGFEYKVHEGKFLNMEEASRIYSELSNDSW